MESEMTCSLSQTLTPMMPKGLQLEISHHPLTLRRVANLVVAMERLKHGVSESFLSTEFRDEHLLNIMLESIVEERIILERDATPSSQYTKSNEYPYSVTDQEQRDLVLVNDSMELHALLLQGGSEKRKVYLNMSTYMTPRPIVDGRPVALGIKDTKLYLSCHMQGEEATLHLETVENKGDLSTVSTESEMIRFLFYKHDTGLDISTLRSARFPNWYISTAKEDNQKVEMCQETSTRYRNFSMERQS